jgi:hypothetical protein
MNDLLFIDWLHEQDWLNFLEWLTINENQLTAATEANNRALNKLLGVSYNWYGVAIQAAGRYVKGQDILSVATDIFTHIIKSLTEKTDKLAKGVEQIQMLSDESAKQTQMIKYISTAIMMRARRFSEIFTNKKAQMSISMSDMGNNNGDNKFNPENQFVAPEKSNFDIEEIKKEVIKELNKMASEANDKRTQARLQKAIEIAPIRMENAPNMVPIGQLMSMFPDIKKTMMHDIIHDIQNAFARVAERMGMQGISASIGKIRQSA